MDEELMLEEILMSIATSLQGIRSELRAMRLEAQQRSNTISEADTEELALAVMESDIVAGIFASGPLLDADNAPSLGSQA